jgi:hypothetical protein
MYMRYSASLALERVSPLCLRVNVARLTLNLFAAWRYEKDVPSLRESIASIAAWIGSMVVELSHVKVGVLLL